MQIYLLTVLYLLFTGLFLLIDNYREYLAFLIRYRHLLLASVRARAVSGALGLILSVLNLFFPSYPGPMYLGDLLPAIALSFRHSTTSRLRRREYRTRHSMPGVRPGEHFLSLPLFFISSFHPV